MYRTKINTRRNRYVPYAMLMAVIIIAVVIPGLAAMWMTPYLQAVTTDSVYVLVECDSNVPVKVDYGTTVSHGASAVTESTELTTIDTFVHNTPAPPAVILAGGVVYEAEDAAIGQGVVETEHAGYTGAGYVNNKNIVGSYVEWTVNATSAGDYTLLFRYGNGGGATRYCDVIVNGTKVVNEGFDSAGPIYPDDWRVWLIKTMQVTLRQGKNTIRVVSTVADGPPNWDRIELALIKATYKQGYAGGPTSATVSTVLMQHPQPDLRQ